MTKRVLYEKDHIMEIKLKNRRILVELINDKIKIITKRLINPDDSIKALKKNGFKVYKNKIAYFKFILTIEAFEEIVLAYSYLRDLNNKLKTYQDLKTQIYENSFPTIILKDNEVEYIYKFTKDQHRKLTEINEEIKKIRLLKENSDDKLMGEEGHD